MPKIPVFHHIQIFSWVNNSIVKVHGKIDLVGEHLEGSTLHHPGMVVLTITGMLAAAKVMLLTSALFGPGQVPLNGILDLYQFYNSTTWFLNLKPEVPTVVLQNLYEKKVDLANYGVTIGMEHQDK